MSAIILILFLQILKNKFRCRTAAHYNENILSPSLSISLSLFLTFSLSLILSKCYYFRQICLYISTSMHLSLHNSTYYSTFTNILLIQCSIYSSSDLQFRLPVLRITSTTVIFVNYINLRYSVHQFRLCCDRANKIHDTNLVVCL